MNVRSVNFSTVLMDSCYASKSLRLYIESLQKTYSVPLKSNRLVDDSQGRTTYQRIDTLQWTDAEQHCGKRLKLHKFPKDHKVKVFRVASSQRTDYVATHDLSQSDVSVVRQVCDVRWKIEQFHREAKQLTELEKCQCRLPRIVRNHIASAFLVWVHLMRKAHQTGQTVYQVKHGWISEYFMSTTQITYSKNTDCVSPKHAKTWTQWTAIEDNTLRKLVAEGKTASEIAKVLTNRTIYAIQNRRGILGIHRPYKLSTRTPQYIAEVIKFKMAGWTHAEIAEVYPEKPFILKTGTNTGKM